ncbi:cytochrome P450 89A2-like [Macadamia integrifolia]|uniref:cytochrome P450 89A2-like n=1 Tax=Macadamia integrifolia TaxID=60698 RepID=UPI001C4E4B46|nr:cytochrome P450 89A2-like [Macadamia integrifolia]
MRRMKNSIRVLKNEDEELISDKAQIEEYVTGYYENFHKAATNVYLILFSQSKSKKTKLSLPPGPPSLPIVGSIFLLKRLLTDAEFKDEEGRKMSDEEIVIFICEIMDAASDATSTVFEWIMAHLVKDQTIQEKLFFEIQEVVNSEEEALQKMPYLKGVALEGLRLNPPAHFLLPHTVEEDIVVNGYVIPKKTIVNFMVAGMGRDPQVWKDPMEFKPERFLGEEGEVVDITGSREIKMMPFGAGRRICPGLGIGTLHLEYFLAHLIKSYKWVAVDGQDVDMSEKQEFTWEMKTRLWAHVSQRAK